MHSTTRIILFLSLILLVSSCKTSEKVLYLQDVKVDTPEKIENSQVIKIEPKDMLSIVVSSARAPFASSAGCWMMPVSRARTPSTSHHHLVKKALTAIRALVTPGRLPEPRSVKASVNAGTATAMMMTKTTMATMMTITGYVRVLPI